MYKKVSKEAVGEIDKIKSPITKTLVTAIIIIVVLSTAFIILFFKTDKVMKVSVDDATRAPQLQNITMSSVTNTLTSGNSNNDPTNIDMSEWYTDLDGIQKDTSQPVPLLTDFNAYKGSPWDNPKYIFNQPVAVSDLYDYLVGLGVDTSVPQGSKDYVLKNWINYGGGIGVWGWYPNTNATAYNNFRSETPLSDGTMVHNIDGIDCLEFAPNPSMCIRDWYSANKWCATGSTYTTYKNEFWEAAIDQKFAVIIVKPGDDKTDRNNWIWVPFRGVDTKAHTWPWGVVQTSITTDPQNNKAVPWPASSTPNITVTPDLSSEEYIKEFCVKWKVGSYNILSYMWDDIEMYHYSTRSSLMNKLKEYEYVGIVAYE